MDVECFQIYLQLESKLGSGPEGVLAPAGKPRGHASQRVPKLYLLPLIWFPLLRLALWINTSLGCLLGPGLASPQDATFGTPSADPQPMQPWVPGLLLVPTSIEMIIWIFLR